VAVLTCSSGQLCVACGNQHWFPQATTTRLQTVAGDVITGYVLECGCHLDTPPWVIRKDIYSTGSVENSTYRITIVSPSGTASIGQYTYAQMLRQAGP